MEKEELEKLIELSARGFKCPNDLCPDYEKYNQCYNHAHVLCIEFEKYQIEKYEQRREKD
ncbi:hypothetical protein M0R04_15655 [Candidatus Dojkabacteria bacterium]|jgi:hypothetical protein|nr:hypothetical protein [Candidatus Dojkabacteria bacterium]